MSARPYAPSDRDRLLEELNPAQRRAVTHEGRALLVVAGAGTGKTRVLTHRIAWQVAGGFPAHGVLAITFTNKAARVLKSRLAALPGAAGAWAGTFHGLGAYLLRRHAADIGLDPRFTIADRDDQLGLIKNLLKERDIGSDLLRPVDVAAMISHRKNGAGGRPPLDLSYAGLEEAFGELHDAYHARLRASALMDFDDLLLESVRLLEECEDVRRICQDRWRRIFVDEYQDTNLVQRDLLALLHGPEGHITVVGDPDQSIYRWRGAVVKNILDFAEDFPGAEQIVLERNYRSTGHILAAAEAVIERNRERHAKRLFTEASDGARAYVARCRDAEDEGRVIATRIRAWHRAGRRLDEVAVFYRVNALSRGIEMALAAERIPYVVVAGTEFFQRREVKDVLAYARLVANPRDEAAFLRAVNTPRRGIGKASLARIRERALRDGVPLWEAASVPDLGLAKRAQRGLDRFLGIVRRAQAMPRAPVAAILVALIEATGYRDMLADSADELERNRVENVDGFVAHAREYDKSEPDGDLQGFLERTALVSDQDGYEGEQGVVSLMSVHAAKGLEFSCVFIGGAEDGYFPHARSQAEIAGEEEERRLFYVAMTRARESLTMTYAARRQTYMGEVRPDVSPYLHDVPADHVVQEDLASSFGAPAWSAAEFAAQPQGGTDFVREIGAGFAVGERVHHPFFGAGRLHAVGGRGEDTRLTVDFDEVGRKQFLLRYARLEKMP
jgi:DNA helicase-2/ATP-dependent DNA helicase PcrA